MAVKSGRPMVVGHKTQDKLSGLDGLPEYGNDEEIVKYNNSIDSSGKWWWQKWDNPPDSISNDFLTRAEPGGIQYKTLTWWQVGFLMIAETISLGVLSLPQAVSMIGLIPGLLVILVLGIIAWFTGDEIGKFKLRFPFVLDMPDAAYLLFGTYGRNFMAAAQLIVFIFIMAAHITSFSVMMNVLTDHAACTVLFGFIGTVVSFICGLPRTLRSQSFFSIVSSISVSIAVLVTLVDVGVRNSRATEYSLFKSSGMVETVISLLNIILSFTGHVAFFGFASELKKPQDFRKSLTMLIVVSTIFYVITGCMIYAYVQDPIPSPALGASSRIVRKVGYGIAIPTIVVAGVINGHVACKQVYFRIWKNTDIPFQKNFKARASWFMINVAAWILAFLLAQSVPDFHYLLAFVSALLSGWFSFGLTGLFFIYRNYLDIKRGRKLLGLCLNIPLIILGCLICFVGLYATGTVMREGRSGKPWSCANNAT